MRHKETMDLSVPLSSDLKHLLHSCERREEWAMQAIYEEYYSQMMNTVMGYARSESQARDWVHDGFIKVYRNIHRFKHGHSLYSWIKRIMINTCIDQLRKEKIRRTEDVDSAYDISSSSADAISQINEKDLLQIIQQLPPTYKMVVNLYLVQGYSHAEVSDILGCSESTSRSNLVKARKAIRAAIKMRFRS